MSDIPAVVPAVLTEQSVIRAQRLRGGARTFGAIGLAAILLVAVITLAVMVGAAATPARAVIAIILHRLPLLAIDLDTTGTSEAWQRIVMEVRLPRVLTAGVAGAALAYAGTTYQGVFRNPLADSFLLGIASGAALGASIAIMAPLGVDTYGFGLVPPLAFAGACLAVTLAYAAARIGDTVSNTRLILAGVAISSAAGAVTSFILLTGGERAIPIFAFLFGSFNSATWPRLWVALPYIALGGAVIAMHARLLNVLQLDEEQAAQLGIDVLRTKFVLLAAASLIAAAAVAMAGVIGFVGLIVPHVARMLIGTDYRRLLPLAALLGASFLIAADIIARTALQPQEVPVGVVTAIVGAPFFLTLMRARRLGG